MALKSNSFSDAFRYTSSIDGWVTVATGGDVVIDGNWRFGGSSNEATWGTFEPHKTLIQELQSETDKWLSGVEI